MRFSKSQILLLATGILAVLVGNVLARDPVRVMEKNAVDSRGALRGGISPPPHMSEPVFSNAATRTSIALSTSTAAQEQVVDYRMNMVIGQPVASGPVNSGAYTLILGGAFAPPSSLTKGTDDTCVGGANAGNTCAQHADCPGGACRVKNRFISAVLPTDATTGGLKVALMNLDTNSVASPSNYNGTDRWVGAPSLGVSDGVSPSFNAGKLQCAYLGNNWSGVGLLHFYGDVVVPGSTYDAQVCAGPGGPCSPALRLTTAKFGDIVAPLVAGQPNFQDIVSIVDKFQNKPSGPSKTRTKLREAVDPNASVGFLEVSTNVSAFQGKTYKQVFPAVPAICP